MQYQKLFGFLIVIATASASHYRGGSSSWTIRDNSTLASSFRVSIRLTQRHSYRKTYSASTFCNQTTINKNGLIGDGTVSCAGNCSGRSTNGVTYAITNPSTNVPCTDFNDVFDYSSGEGTTDLIIPTNIRFSFIISRCCWIPLLRFNGTGGWSLEVVIDTNRRRDGKFNNSPKTASNPVVQVQVGQTHIIPIPMADSDGDPVRCRWGKTPTECGDICLPKGALQAFPCELTYVATTLGYEGVALVIEDFDVTTGKPLSAIPLQFLIHIVNQTLPPEIPFINSTGPTPLQPCRAPPEYVGDRRHGACIGLGSNTTIIERIVIKIPCNQSSTTVVDILTISPQGMIKTPIQQDLYDNNTYIMSVQWTPRPDQYGIHQLCLQPVGSESQMGQQVCYTFQVDVFPPKFINGSMTPTGLVSPNQSIWSISIDQDIIRPSQAGIFVRFFKRVTSGIDEEIFRIDATASNVHYQSRQITIITNNITWEQGEYYILLDSGMAMLNQSCGIESAPITDSHFWEFNVAFALTTERLSVTEINTKAIFTSAIATATTAIEDPSIINSTTMIDITPMMNSTSLMNVTSTMNSTSLMNTTSTMSSTSTMNATSTMNSTSMMNATSVSIMSTTTSSIQTANSTTINNNLTSICPLWLPLNTIINVTTNDDHPNYTFCFTVNTTMADITIAANTWSPCSTWKISGTADPVMELFTPETSNGSPVAQNDDGNSITHINCYAAVISYRLIKGNHRVVIRHQRCAYGNFELRLLAETANIFK